MRISKLHLALVNDKLRLVLNCMLVKKDETVLTDANQLLIFKSDKLFHVSFLDLIPESGLLIPSSFVSKLTEKNIKGLTYYPEKKEIAIPYKDCFLYSHVYVNEEDLKYPKYQDLFNEEIKEISKIGILTSKLSILCKIFPFTPFKFVFKGNDKGIEIYITNNDEPAFIKGLLMPHLIFEL